MATLFIHIYKHVSYQNQPSYYLSALLQRTNMSRWDWRPAVYVPPHHGITTKSSLFRPGCCWSPTPRLPLVYLFSFLVYVIRYSDNACLYSLALSPSPPLPIFPCPPSVLSGWWMEWFRSWLRLLSTFNRRKFHAFSFQIFYFLINSSSASIVWYKSKRQSVIKLSSPLSGLSMKLCANRFSWTKSTCTFEDC